MNVTAEHAGGSVVLELDEGCRSVAALRRIICAALPDLREEGFDVTVQGSVLEDVDVCGLEEGTTIEVVESRRAVALEALRAAGRDVSERGLRDGIVSAVEDRNKALCEQYLDAGCDVNALNSHGSHAPLHAAAGRYFPELCTLLLQRGADVNRQNGDWGTPLHRCSWAEHTGAHATREVLLSHGADMRACDLYFESPLDLARRARKSIFTQRDLATLRGRKWRGQIPPFNALDQFVKYGAPKMRWSNRYGPKGYTGGIHKLAKVQFKERKQQITAKGMRIVNAFVEDVLERLGGEAGRVTSFSGAKTLSVRSVVAAVKLQLPEELATHALAAGTEAVRRYAKACGRR